jgi:hypothetical protein
MKKLLAILVLGLLLISNISQAKIKSIGNGLTINIPNNYKYFELTFRQLISRFPELGSEIQVYDDLGLGMGTKLIVIANNQKTINFFNDLTSVAGLEKLNRKHLQPMMKKFTDPKFIKKMMKDIQSIKPNADLENMSEEEFMEIMEELSESPKMIKKYERILNPYLKKFNREYDLNKYTMILIGDKNAEYLEEIKEESISDLTENLKDLLEEFYEETKDPSLKGIRDWQFEIAKNHNGNLYLYSDDSLQSPYLTSRYYSETFWTSHNNKIFIATSICAEKCNASTDLLDVIKPTNLFVESNSITADSKNNNLVEQLNSLNKLYKSGVLTKEEFEKAKKKLLN